MLRSHVVHHAPRNGTRVRVDGLFRLGFGGGLVGKAEHRPSAAEIGELIGGEGDGGGGGGGGRGDGGGLLRWRFVEEELLLKLLESDVV